MIAPIILGLFVLGWYVKEEKAKNEELIRVFEERQEKQGSEKIDTSDWKTYRNEELGFEFKYPSDWTYNEGFNNKVVAFGKIDCATEYDDSTVNSCDSSVGVYVNDDKKLICNIDSQRTPLITLSSAESRRATCSSFQGNWLYYWYKMSNDGKDFLVYMRKEEEYDREKGGKPNNRLFWEWKNSENPTEYYDYVYLPNMLVERKILETFSFVKN